MLNLLFNLGPGLEACKFIEKETPTQVFSYELRKTFNNTFVTEHLRVTAFKEMFNNKNDFWLAYFHLAAIYIAITEQ